MFLFPALLLRVTTEKHQSQENGPSPIINTEKDLLLKLILSNPLIKRPGDEVNQKALVK